MLIINSTGGTINSKLVAKPDIGFPVDADTGKAKPGSASIRRSIYPAFLLSILSHVPEFFKNPFN
jgi:hypothetical protein